MKKSTKGAIAAAAAAVLLLGGGGTLAFWQATQNVTGGDINSGHLNLITDAVNTGCEDWELDSGENVSQVYADGDPLVPGDHLRKECNFTIEAEGNHLRATVEASAPSASDSVGTLISSGDITIDATDIQVDGSPATEFTEDNDGQTLTVFVTVAFDPATTINEDSSAVLDDITVTANQIHQ